MAVYYSTRMKDLLAGKPITVTDAGSQIAAVAATDRFTTTQNDFLTKGFRPGQVVVSTNFNLSANDGYWPITEVAAGYIETSGSLTDEAAAAGTPTIALVNGLNVPLMFKDGIFVLRSSPMPASADALETGTILAELTLAGASFTGGVSAAGLEVEFTLDGVFNLKSGEDWRDSTPNATGTAYWGMFYDNAYITGDDSTNKVSPRIMGSVGTDSNSDFVITSTSIVTTVPVVCTQFQGTQASQACS